MIGRLGHISPPRTVVDYLVVAGGGGGGTSNAEVDGGHGGAGGVLDGAVSLLRGQGVTVTVGTGGAIGAQGTTAANGTDSVLASIVATGGGGGGAAPGSVPGTGSNGGNGGSGGGGGRGGSGGTDGTAGTGIAGQGNNGSGANGGARYLSSDITGTQYFYGNSGTNDLSYVPRDNYGDGGRAGFEYATNNFIVSGAGTTAANGTYSPSGTLNGQTRYRLGSTTYYIVWLGTNVGDWIIASDADGSNTLYTGTSNIASPAGSTTVNAGDSPAPSITADETTSAPTAGATGVVIIAYPNTLPALAIGNGLTYDQPTRAGYRVYRFTGGTGTITP
jgi:hypothetical protein